MELDRLSIRREGSGRRLESNDVVDVKPDADSFANRVIVMGRHQREHFDATPQAQGIQNLGATKRFVPDLGEQVAAIVVDDVVRSQQHFDAAVLAATLAALAAFERQARGKDTQLDLDTSVVDHQARQENALANEVGDKSVCGLVVDPVWAVPLLDGPRGHDADLVGHGKGFVLIVSDQQGRDLLGLEDLAHFQRQALAQVDVEIGEGFIEQDQLRTRRQGAGQRHALLLATGEFMRIALLGAGEPLLVLPGGSRECFRSSRVRYTLDWGQRQGYARLAVRNNLPIVLFASEGADDLYQVIGDGYRLSKRLTGTDLLPLCLPLGSHGLPFGPSKRVKLTTRLLGPILPVLGVDDADGAVRFVNERPHPLALYVFSNDEARAERVIERTHSGGAAINATVMHIAAPDLPFGGVGPSGTGAYHGEAGFLTFSHRRSVLARATRPDPPVLYPPYKGWKQKLLRKVL